jgi:signal transduction histidine kinase
MTDGVNFAEMISKIAHELRSPLTSLQGFSSTLIKRWDRFTDEQRKELVATIGYDAKRMGRIVAEILDLARMEAGRLELSPAAAELRHIAETAVEGLAQLPGIERVSLDIPELLTAWADPIRIGHVISNLLENALKFSDEGPIEISAERSGDKVMIRFADRGVGIEAERVDAIFDGPAPAVGGKASPSGSGLGLYLSKKLVLAHGGELTVESEPGEGSTFTVTLPAESPA